MVAAGQGKHHRHQENPGDRKVQHHKACSCDGAETCSLQEEDTEVVQVHRCPRHRGNNAQQLPDSAQIPTPMYHVIQGRVISLANSVLCHI